MRAKRRIASDLLLAASPLALAVAVYGYSVTMPFFLDDGPHFQILSQTNNSLRHWGDFPAFPFYRPLTFSFWKLTETVFGAYQAPFLHYVNVLCFGLGGVLLVQIGRRLIPDRRMVAAGWLFVLFPYSYQAVVMVAALFHLMLIVGMLLCMWAALRWLDTSRPELLVLAYVGAFVGVFSHENGILLLPLLIGLLFITHRTTPLPKLAIVVVPVGALVLIYTALWWSFRPQEGTALSDSVQGGAAMLLQGLIYPVVMAVRPFVSGDADVMTILLLVILTTGLVMLLVGMQNRRRLLPVSYGLGWYVLAVLPAAIFLPAGYVLGQPRLALLASVGGSLFWTMALVAVLSSWNMLGKILFLFVVGGMLLLSFEFLSMRRAEFLRLRDFNREAVTLLETNRAFEADTVMVNMPDYLTPPEYKRRFLLGTEGVLFVDETLDYSQQFTMNSSFNFDSVDVIAYPSIQRSEGFGFRAHPPVLDRQRVVDSVHDAEQVYVTQFDTREFYPVLVGGTALTDGALTDGEFAVFEGGNLRLNSGEYNLHEDVIVVSTTWTVAQPSAVKLFVHVYCDESFIAQSDGYPWGDTYPFLYWQVGETQTDIRQIALESDYNEDCLQVFAGLYYESDITRLEAVAPEGVAPYIDNLVPLTRAS